jgi:hypothetical protein
MRRPRPSAHGTVVRFRKDADTVEHRWFPRRPAEFQVNVIPSDLPAALGRTTDIGLGGMFVTMNAEHLQANDLVSALIYLGTRCYHTQAFVTRVTSKGVALMFAHLDRKTLEFLLILETGDGQANVEACGA